MTKINTVLGTIDSSELGYTRIHEHLLWKWPGIELDPLAQFDEEAAFRSVTEMLREAKKKGVSTLVDATPLNLFRQIEFFKRVADTSAINIIAATGLTNPLLPFYFAQMSIDHLAGIMESEITRGIPGTGVKAGVIKVGTAGGPISEPENKILRAAARASISTGVPIITHTDNGVLGIEQADIFKSEGVDLSRVVIGHTCCNSDIKYYLGIIERGAYAGFDRIGYSEYQRDEVRLVAIAGLIAAGYASRIALSQDLLAVIALMPGLPVPRDRKKITYLEDEFIPRLLEGGISSRSIEQIMVENPRHLFGA